MLFHKLLKDICGCSRWHCQPRITLGVSPQEALVGFYHGDLLQNQPQRFWKPAMLIFSSYAQIQSSSNPRVIWTCQLFVCVTRFVSTQIQAVLSGMRGFFLQGYLNFQTWLHLKFLSFDQKINLLKQSKNIVKEQQFAWWMQEIHHVSQI